MIINPEFDRFVQAELEQLRSSADAHRRAPPSRLLYPTDAAGLDAVIRSGALPAWDWRLAHEPALVRYGVELVEEFLAQPAHRADDALRTRFRQAALANLHPRGTHFDGFVARLFEHAAPNAAAHCPGYALGVRTGALPAQPQHAIYERAQQCAIVASAYQACEDYFVGAVARFGERVGSDLLTPCWDTFRHLIGPFLMRFRDPALAHQHEWTVVAPAPSGPAPQADPVRFAIVDNRLVPHAALVLGARPLESIAIAPALPFATTREALRAYLRRRHMGGLALVPVAGCGISEATIA